MDKTQTLFVYGTLRPGGFLNGALRQGGATYIGTDRTEPLYRLHYVGIPLLSHGGHDSILGDLYVIEDRDLYVYLDRLEGCYMDSPPKERGHHGYYRAPVKLASAHAAEAYFFDVEEGSMEAIAPNRDEAVCFLTHIANLSNMEIRL